MNKVYVSLNGVKNLKALDSALEKALEEKIDGFHFDVIDGGLTTQRPTWSYFCPSYIEKVIAYAAEYKEDITFPVDVHLFVEEVPRIAHPFLETRVSSLTIPYNAFDNNKELIAYVKSIRKPNDLSRKVRQVGVSFNSGNTISQRNINLFSNIDYAVVIGSGPGFDVAPMMPETDETVWKISDMKRYVTNSFDIFVDGGVTPENVDKLRRVGANGFIVGNAFFMSDDPSKFIRAIKKN